MKRDGNHKHRHTRKFLQEKSSSNRNHSQARPHHEPCLPGLPAVPVPRRSATTFLHSVTSLETIQPRLCTTRKAIHRGLGTSLLIIQNACCFSNTPMETKATNSKNVHYRVGQACKMNLLQIIIFCK